MMPWFDRTGPRGRGPRTGRGMGYCPPGGTRRVRRPRRLRRFGDDYVEVEKELDRIEEEKVDKGDTPKKIVKNIIG